MAKKNLSLTNDLVGPKKLLKTWTYLRRDVEFNTVMEYTKVVGILSVKVGITESLGT